MLNVTAVLQHLVGISNSIEKESMKLYDRVSKIENNTKAKKLADDLEDFTALTSHGSLTSMGGL